MVTSGRSTAPDRRMDTETHNSGCLGWGKPKHVGEVSVERDQNPLLFDSRVPHYGIVGCGKSQFHH
jgi:hypothetical protein